MEILTKGRLDCGASISFSRPNAFAKARAEQGAVGACFPLVFVDGSITVLHWLPVTQGSDQYRVSGAAEQQARGLESMHMLHGMCNVVMRGQCQARLTACTDFWVCVFLLRQKCKDWSNSCSVSEPMQMICALQSPYHWEIAECFE